MSLEAIELLGEADRLAYADHLARELQAGTAQECFVARRVPAAFEAIAAPRKKVQHGTVSGYTYGKCRCDECRRAKREYERQRTTRTVSAKVIAIHRNRRQEARDRAAEAV